MSDAHLCNVQVAGEEAPVYICSVANIWVVVVGCCKLQDLLDEALVVARLFEEELNHGSQDLKLRLKRT